MAKEKRQQQLPQTTRERQRIEKLAATLQQESSTLKIIYLNSNLNFARVNSAYVKGPGHTVDELIGQNHFDIFPNKENQAIFEIVRVPLSSLPYLWHIADLLKISGGISKNKWHR